MALFTVVLDPSGQRQEYQAFHREMRKMKWAKATAWAWVVEDTGKSRDVFERLEPHIGDKDQLLVIECVPDYTGRIEDGAHNWLAVQVRGRG